MTLKPEKEKRQKRGRVTRNDVQKEHARRSQKAQEMDERLKAKEAKSYEEWMEQPNRRDLKGVDMPEKKSAKQTQKHTKQKSEQKTLDKELDDILKEYREKGPEDPRYGLSTGRWQTKIETVSGKKTRAGHILNPTERYNRYYQDLKTIGFKEHIIDDFRIDFPDENDIYRKRLEYYIDTERQSKDWRTREENVNKLMSERDKNRSIVKNFTKNEQKLRKSLSNDKYVEEAKKYEKARENVERLDGEIFHEYEKITDLQDREKIHSDASIMEVDVEHIKAGYDAKYSLEYYEESRDIIRSIQSYRAFEEEFQGLRQINAITTVVIDYEDEQSRLNKKTHETADKNTKNEYINKTNILTHESKELREKRASLISKFLEYRNDDGVERMADYYLYKLSYIKYTKGTNSREYRHTSAIANIIFSANVKRNNQRRDFNGFVRDISKSTTPEQVDKVLERVRKSKIEDGSRNPFIFQLEEKAKKRKEFIRKKQRE